MKKRTMEKEHQAEERRKKVLMEIAGAVVVLTVIVSIGLSHLGTDKVNTSAGVTAIKKLEKADVQCRVMQGGLSCGEETGKGRSTAVCKKTGGMQ